MLMLLEKSNNPYKDIIQSGLFVAAITLLILFVFQPFGTFEADISYKYLKLFGYGAVTFCAIVLAGLLELMLLNPQTFTQLEKYKRHRFWIVPLLYVTCAAIFNHGYFAVSVLGAWHWQNQLLFFLYVGAVAIFPVAFLVVNNSKNKVGNREHSHLDYSSLDHSKHQRTNQQLDAGSMSIDDVQPENLDESTHPVSDLAKQAHSKSVSSDLIALVGDNKAERLEISASQLVYIKAAENYCEVVYLLQYDENPELQVSEKKAASQQSVLLRTSLTKLLEQTPADVKVMRCHRSYAVNVEQVTAYSGNAAGLSLQTDACDLSVPVSRRYVNDIKAALSVSP
ncbi:LytTR family transcriptional regulator [Shewanella maritima]|uniref:LytTR family transcriptional regulator n=1 Tax=Shewanella maritima TaxID=2520507 RepID=A0A411PL32_9GAMM|nr:LytTR family DNA-binding domain-containing protein [Shewanella maritima]QBF84236.1 LytTR family transcriptional regulator [Shewanella maritima]